MNSSSCNKEKIKHGCCHENNSIINKHEIVEEVKNDFVFFHFQHSDVYIS